MTASFGRKPWLYAPKYLSYPNDNTCAVVCWITRSTTVGIPNGCFFLLAVGKYTRLTGCGLCCFVRVCALISALCVAKYPPSSSTVILSTPAAPLFRLTFLIAVWMFSSFRIQLISSASVLLLLLVKLSEIPPTFCLPAYVPACWAYPRFRCVPTLLTVIRIALTLVKGLDRASRYQNLAFGIHAQESKNNVRYYH